MLFCVQARNAQEAAKSRQNEQKATDPKNNEGKKKSSQKATESGKKHSINPNFVSAYDNWDKKSRRTFTLGTVSDKLSKAVANDKLKGRVIQWDGSKIIKILNKHENMTDSVIKSVPEILENPIIVMKSKSVVNRYVVFGEIYDAKENPVLVALELKPTNNKGVELDVVKIASAYGKDVNLQGFLDKSEITFIDENKKRVTNWLTQNRLKLPLLSTSNNSTNSIPQNKNTVNGSISEDGEVRFSEKEKNITIIEQLKQAKGKLDKMSPVIEVNESREFKTNVEKIAFFENILHEQGDKIYRQGFGEVVIGKNQYKKALAYLKTYDEIISFAAVPKVIETGIKIGEHLNHKDRGYSTTTFGAKIKLNGQIASIAVVVKQTNRNYYKVHRVLMSDDSVLEFIDNKKEELETARVAREKTRVLSKPTNSSNNNIPQNKNTVNGSVSEKTSAKGAVTESYKQEWTLSAKEKVTESVIKQIANEYAKRGINVDIVYEENGNNGQWNPKTNTVTVNLAANNPIEVFFHEAMGHVIHDYANENWQDIKSAAFTYMASLEDVSIDDIRNHKIDQYKKNGLSYTSELIDEEIVSDMIGAMAQDKNSVQKLYNSLVESGTEETLAQRIVRKIKELLMNLKLHFTNLEGKYNSAIAKAAKENRPSDSAFSEYLDKVNSILSQSFENLEVAENGDTKYSIKYTTENKPVVVIEENILDNVPKNEWVKTVKGVMSEKFSDGIPISGRLIKVNAITRNEFTNSKNSRYYRGHNRKVYVDKFKSANNIDEIVLASTNYVNEDLMHERKDNFKEFARGDVLIRVGNTDYSAKVVVGFTSGKEMVLYDVIDFKPTAFKIKKVGAHTVQSQNAKNRRNATPTNNNISQNDTIVNNSISENGENDTRFSLKEDVDKIPGVAYNNTKKLAEHNEYEDFMPSGAMGKEIRNKVIQSFGDMDFGNEAAIVDFYFNDYRMTISYVSPTNCKLIDFHEIEDEKRRNIYAKRNRRTNSGYSSGKGGHGTRYTRNDDMLSRNRGTTEENAGVSQSQSERNGRGYSGRADVHNGETETSEAEALIKKYSLMEDVDIKAAQAAIKANQELEKQVKLAGKLFKKAGTVLDKSKTDAIANTIADRYEVTNPKYRELLSDKLYAYYTYVARGDASEAQTAIYGYELAQDIAAMSEEIAENPSNNFFEEYGESIYDVISLDIAKEYAEKAIIKAPRELEQEHKEIADEYRKIKDSGGDIKAIYKALKAKTEELVGARKQYAKSRSEVSELRELFRKTKRAYERKVGKQKASKKAVSQAAKVVDNDSKSGIIKSLDIDDFKMMSEGRNIDPKAIDLIASTVKQYEDKGQIFISDFFFGSLPNEANGTPLLQIEPIADKTLRLNVNVDVFSGKTVAEINKLLAECEKNLSNSLEEAIIHECGHARAIKGLTIKEIKSLYCEIEDAKIEGISQIAFEDGAEALAEIEVLLARSDKVPEKAMRFYEKYIRRKK